MTTALVTGASAGIGAAFARRLAADGHRLVLVARSGDRLRALADELGAAHGTPVEVLPADLTDPAGRDTVAARLRRDDVPVTLLVNNAGIGTRGTFWKVPYETVETQLELNVTAVLQLTHAALPGMVARGAGRVLNVASVAGLVPGLDATYAASKSWVVAFSEGLSASLRGTGVRVAALCPGFTRTEFHDRMGVDMSGTPSWAWTPLDEVVETGLRALDRDAVVAVPSRRYQAVVTLSRLLPRRVSRSLTSRTSRSRGART